MTSIVKPRIRAYAANELNKTTHTYNKEACCNLYSVANENGEREFFTGQSYTGLHNNVIGPYLYSLNTDRLLMELSHADKGIRYEGYIHSHPYCTWHDGNNFSSADYYTAKRRGRVYLSRPTGEVLVSEGDNVRVGSKHQKANQAHDRLVVSGAYDKATNYPKAIAHSDMVIQEIRRIEQAIKDYLEAQKGEK